jgi:hypothetical protein
MTSTAHRVRVQYARRMPHATFPTIDKHFFNVRVSDMKEAFRLDANPRDAEGRDLNRQVYKDVRDSLLGRTAIPGTFDLMNRGLTIIAERVVKISDDEYEIIVDDGQGVADGGHTQELLKKFHADAELPDEQTVDLKVLSGVPGPMVSDIAKGLNTGLQVKEHTIANHRGEFDWLKEIIDPQPFAALISWRENEKGEYDVRDLLSIIEALNAVDFPNNKPGHPYHAYEKSSTTVKSFIANPAKYKRFAPIVVEALQLYDIIRHDFYDLRLKAGGSPGALKIVEGARPGTKLDFPFAGFPPAQYRLHKGATFPILASFRNMVHVGDDGADVGWRGGFDAVAKSWTDYGAELVAVTFNATKEIGRFPDQLGKSRGHWDNLHKTLKIRLMEERADVFA